VLNKNASMSSAEERKEKLTKNQQIQGSNSLPPPARATFKKAAAEPD
jgi:hypothetical protein